MHTAVDATRVVLGVAAAAAAVAQMAAGTSMHPARFPSELPHPACTVATAVAVAAAAWQRPLQPLHLAVACAPSAAVTVAAAAVVLHAPQAAAKATAATAELLSRPWQRPLHAPQQLRCCSRDCSYCTRRGSCCHSHSSGRCMRPRQLRYRRRQQLHARRDSCSHSYDSSRCMQFRPANVPPEPTSGAAVGASRPPCMLRTIHFSERCVHQQADYTRIRLSRCPSRSRPAPRARLYSVRRGTFPATKAALGLQPAASAASLG